MADLTTTTEVETRTRRRIRKAVESRGYQVAAMTYEPAYNAGEKCGLAGGWTVTTSQKFRPSSWPGNEVCGLSVEEVLADIDWSIAPTEVCDCVRPRHYSPVSPIKGDPQTPLHDRGCRWYIHYRLPWWGYDEGEAV